jgi:putative DNA primase/helicase
MTFAFDRAAAPEDLAARRQWLLWRYVTKAKAVKPAKLPYYASGHVRGWPHGKPEDGIATLAQPQVEQGHELDRAALVTLEEALQVAAGGRWAGVGFAFLPGDGLIGIDLDKVIDASTGEIRVGAGKIIAAFSSYTEYSPSGTGVHIIVKGGPIQSAKSNDIGVEVFCGSQFFTWTARPYGPLMPVVEAPAEALARLLQVVADAKEKRRSKAAAAPRRQGGAAMPEDLRRKIESALAYVSADCDYDDWIGIGGVIYGALGEGAFSVWDAWSAKGATYPGEARLQSHWTSFRTFGPSDGAGIFKRAIEAGWRPPKAPRAAKPAKGAAAPPKPISTPSKAPAEDAGGGGPPDRAPPGHPAAVEDEDDWRAALIWKRGELKECRENVLMILRDHSDWRGVLAVDTFAKKIVIRRESPLGQRAGDEWSANDDVALGLWLAQREQMQVSSLDAMAAAVSYVAKLQPFHPVIDYFNTLHWDGEARIDHWGPTLLGCADTEYDRLVGRLFLINMVRRIFEPGCVMRSVPVLEGAQNKGKSTALRLLAQPWYSDTMFRVGDKDAFQLIQGVMVYEISELESFSRAEATAVKAFISSVQDKFRAPYARSPETHLRQTMFAATTNAREYLKDWTGNTRFWPWRLMVAGEIQLDKIAQHRDQLLAEAIYVYRRARKAGAALARAGPLDPAERARLEIEVEGGRSYPTREQEQTLFAPEQEERLVPHPWQDKLRAWLDLQTGQRFSVMELLKEGIGFDIARASPQGMEAQTVGRVMASLSGWEKKRTPTGWVWERPRASAVAKIEVPGQQSDTTEQKEDLVDPF